MLNSEFLNAKKHKDLLQGPLRREREKEQEACQPIGLKHRDLIQRFCAWIHAIASTFRSLESCGAVLKNNKEEINTSPTLWMQKTSIPALASSWIWGAKSGNQERGHPGTATA